MTNFNEADEDWYRFGGGKGSHISMEDGEPVHYYSSSPCPTCGGTEGWHDDEEENTHHWCGYNASIGVMCGDCFSPINDMNPNLERIQTDEMMPAIQAMREAKGLKSHHPSGCLRCLEQHRTTGKLPYTIEQQAMGFPFNPDGHWRKEDMDDDTELLRSSMSAFDRAWDVVKMPWYYHATPEQNMMPILHEGIKPGFDGLVYASKDPELARRWISFTRKDAPKVATIPFWRDEGDPRISPGMDHAPMMVDMLMGPDYEGHEGAAITSNEAIPREDLLPYLMEEGTPSNEDKSAGNPGVAIHDNPFHDPDLQEKMKFLRQLNDLKDRTMDDYRD